MHLQHQRVVITFEGKQQTLAESWSSSPRAPFHTQQPEKEFLPRKDDTSSIFILMVYCTLASVFFGFLVVNGRSIYVLTGKLVVVLEPQYFNAARS
jgi:hypothetical protein